MVWPIMGTPPWYAGPQSKSMRANELRKSQVSSWRSISVAINTVPPRDLDRLTPAALTSLHLDNSCIVCRANCSLERQSSSAAQGTLVVLVNWGDLNNTPATDVWIEAHGFVPKYHSERSFVLKLFQPGQYQASLPPAVYDVFVSEGTSLPRCKRVLITPGLPD